MIIRALNMLGEKTVGGTLTSAEQTEYLSVLNTMLESWSNERLLIYQILEEAFTLVVNQNNYTIGSGGSFNTTRPIKIEDSCFIREDDTIYSVVVVDERTFSGLQTVAQSDRPRHLYFDVSVPLATIYFDYTPDSAYEFHLKSWKQIQTFGAIGTTVSLPLGYQRAIESNLAIELAPGLTSVSQEVAKIAKDSKAAIKSMNIPEYRLGLDAGVVSHRFGSGNIYTG
jgi:hypothetical protein